jgi:hypothetical protein
MGNTRKTSPKVLEDFCQLRHSGVIIAKAAKQVGMSPDWGKKISKTKEVKDRIKAIAADYSKKITTAKAKKTIREVTIDRNDITMALADIAGIGIKKRIAESERARVAALVCLTDIFMMRAKNVREVKDFYGWTADELRDYAISGTVPQRLGLLVGEGQGAGLGGSPSLRTDKK